MLYLTGVSGPAVRRYAAHNHHLGLLTTPRSRLFPRPCFSFWAADNGAFNAKTYVGDEKWFAWLTRLAPHAGNCLFATAPDVVGDAAETLKRSAPWLAKIRELGYPPAFVAQDGIEDTDVPWDDFDVLFLGGTDDFKLGPVAVEYAAEAHARGKLVHCGRVNSFNRLRYAQLELHADTADGTFLSSSPDHNLGRLDVWFDKLVAKRTNEYEQALLAAVGQ